MKTVLNTHDDARSALPAAEFSVWVHGGVPDAPQHFHIESPAEGWEVEIFLPKGDLRSINVRGSRSEADDFADVLDRVARWLDAPTQLPNHCGTNRQVAADEWKACQND